VKFLPLTHTRFISTEILFIVFLLFSNSTVFGQTNDKERDTTIKSKVIVEDTYLDTVISAEPYAEKKSGDENVTEYFNLKDSALPFDSLSKQQLPDSVTKAMQQDEDFWYANYVFDKKKEKLIKEYTPLREKTWFKTLMWLIIIGGFAYALIAYLGSNNVGLFRRSVQSIADENEMEETENIFEINYKERIERAVKAENFQLAVRLHFLQLLKTLSNKNVIQYKQARTNFDYLLQLRNTSYYNGFFRLTRNYEFAWFGNFPVNKEIYGIIKNDFEKFDNEMPRK